MTLTEACEKAAAKPRTVEDVDKGLRNAFDWLVSLSSADFERQIEICWLRSQVKFLQVWCASLTVSLGAIIWWVKL